MRVHFWGTRGSIPVALSGTGVRQKIKRALCKANGRHFESETAIEHFIEAELDFLTRDGYGGKSACVAITGSADYMGCDLGSELRCLGQHVMQEHSPRQPQVYNFCMSHVH